MKKIVLVLMALSIMSFSGDFEDGFAAYNKQDYKKAIELFTKAVNQGDVLAQYGLGLMYYKGQGAKQDYKKTVELYTKAANQGDSKAQLNLGYMYIMGKRVKKDKIKAYQYWIKSAKQGDETA